MLTRPQIAALEQRLLEERQSAARAVRELGREIENLAAWQRDSGTPYDAGQNGATDGDTAASIVQRHTERLSLIDNALNRLRETPEDFNVSVVSGLTIPYERLESVPWTRVLEGEVEPQRATGGAAPRDDQAGIEPQSDSSSQEESRAGI